MILDLTHVPVIDGTAALAIEDMLKMVKRHKQHLFFVGMKANVSEVLEGLGVLELLQPGHRYERRLDALNHAARSARSSRSKKRPVTN